jgi:hypothetical protein
MKSSSTMNVNELPNEEASVWDQFRDDIEMLERLRVTPQELSALKNCVLLGTLSCKEDMLFILRQIRIATGRESEDSDDSADEMSFAPPPIPRRVSKPANNVSAPANRRSNTVNRTAAEPGSHGAIIRSRVLGQFAIACGALILASFLMWRVVSGRSSWTQHNLTTTGIESHEPVAPGGASQS